MPAAADTIDRGERFVTNKLPHNFQQLGLFGLLFPNAPIVHIKRDPRDNLLSIYFQNFVGFHDFAYDLKALGLLSAVHQLRRTLEAVRTVPQADVRGARRDWRLSTPPLPAVHQRVMLNSTMTLALFGFIHSGSGPPCACSNSVYGLGHDLRGRPHQVAQRGRQIGATVRLGLTAVLDLIDLHLLQDGAGAQIIDRNLFQVFVEVALDLFLGLGDETQAPTVAGDPGGRANRERAGIKQRIEQAESPAQLLHALLAPVKVIVFLGGGTFHAPAHGRITGGQRLTLV
jgi:hypothetical protein